MASWFSGARACAPPAHVLSVTGRLLMQTLRRIGAAGWFVLKALLSVVWLAVVAPGGYFGFLCWHSLRGFWQSGTRNKWLT